METLGMTYSICKTCRKLVPAKILTDGNDVYFHKFCAEHGEEKTFVRSDVHDYLRTLQYVKPAMLPDEFAGAANSFCADGCGFCNRHEQHLCLPIIEITSRCDLECPVCLVDAGTNWNMTVEEFDKLLDGIIRAEKRINMLNLSGGEPLCHPNLMAIIDNALSWKEITRVSISTNGLALLTNKSLLHELRQRNVVISLQFTALRKKPIGISGASLFSLKSLKFLIFSKRRDSPLRSR